jgi:invasion protein IalB
MRNHHMPTFAAGLLIALAGAAQAQAPQRTTATFEDWTVRCETIDNTTRCEMAQGVQIQGQAGPLTQIALGRPNKNEPVKIVFQVPIDVWLPAGVKLVLDDKDPGIAVAFKRCLAGGACFADTELKDEMIKKLRGLTANGKLEFKDGAQRDIAIPVSFKGFGAAFDAMSKP